MVFSDYRVTSEYGYRIHPIRGGRIFHAGIDLAKEHQGPIHAFTAGEVTHAGWGEKGSGFGGYGYVVAVKDEKGSLHCYCHLDSVAVEVGDTVKKDEVVGYQGDTPKENVTGSHLHYEIRKQASPSYGWTDDVKKSTYDPTEYLNRLAKDSDK